ncbi:streptophobe family protein [Streptomyces sp. NPDC085946]|uniref:streptophobe family protein n=1 Tax=Streptomyces sp. NPDC085946 TaxID=3365744 RepID=UPI0037CE79D3
MGASTGVGTAGGGTRVPWGDVVLTAIASVSWALIGMAGTAAAGLHLLRADAAGSLGPMTAAVVALGAGGSVTPSGEVSVFGLTGARADTAVEITPLGVSLVGALLLSFFFLRSLRTAGCWISPAELLARAGAVVALFVAMLGGLARAGHDVVTLDGSSLELGDLPGADGDGGAGVPGLGDLGGIGDVEGLLPGRIGDLVDARAAVGFTVDTAPTLLGGAVWSAGILLVALLASRRTPLPRGWDAVHRVVRPAVSAVVTVLLLAVAAGLAAAAYAATGDGRPRRIAGAALLGAPNGVWLGVPVGLFVPWDGRSTGELTGVLPDPLDELLGAGRAEPVTLARLAELEPRVWLLGVAAAVAMLLAGVLTAVRTPVVPAPGGGSVGVLGFAGRCAVRLGAATALALPLLTWLTEVSVNASLSVLGFDAFGAGIDMRGHLGAALLLGAVWGAGAGAAGALPAWASGAAGRGAVAWAVAGSGAGVGSGNGAVPEGGVVPGTGAGAAGAGGSWGSWGGAGTGSPAYAERPGPYEPGTPYRPPDPAANPYLRVPGEPRPPQDARPGGAGPGPGGPPAGQDGTRPPGGSRRDEESPPDGEDGDVHGAPTVARPRGAPPRGPGRPPAPRAGQRPRSRPDDGPPPPPPPPPPASPRRPGGGR